LPKKSFDTIIGDININIIPDALDSNGELYLNTVASHGMLPAHIMPTRNANCLDHVILKTKLNAITLILDAYITDHAPVILCGCYEQSLVNAKRSYTLTNIEACTRDLESFNFSSLLSCREAELAATSLVSIISDIVRKHTSNISVPSRKRIIKPWITPGLLRCLRHRDKLFLKSKKHPENLCSRLVHVRYRNFVSNLLKKVKREYERAEFEKVVKNPKATWKLIKKVGNINKTLNSNSKLLGNCCDPSSSVNDINKFFANIGKKLALNITGSEEFQCPMNDQTLESTSVAPLNSMTLHDTDSDEITHVIDSLKNTSATGWDGISTSLVKSAKNTLVPIIVHIFNLCLTSGTFPLAFKKALVHPVYKSGDRDSVGNYRPISVLTTLSKILEKILNKRLINYLECKNILANNQYGFRSDPLRMQY
jgi:hypothetical protein